jgi:hypothetical protein
MFLCIVKTAAPLLSENARFCGSSGQAVQVPENTPSGAFYETIRPPNTGGALVGFSQTINDPHFPDT